MDLGFSTIPKPHGFKPDLCRQLEDLVQVCAFQNHGQRLDFTTAGLQLRCGNTSKMVKRHIKGSVVCMVSLSVKQQALAYLV